VLPRVWQKQVRGWCWHIALAVCAYGVVLSSAPLSRAEGGEPHVAILCGPQRPFRQAAALARLAAANPTVIATAGGTATFVALDKVPDVPVVFFMVPNVLDAGFMAEALAVGRPALRTLFVSGYTGDPIANRGVHDEDVDLLAKPFTCCQLLQRVREVLNKERMAPR
jgi:hypothetical protein